MTFVRAVLIPVLSSPSVRTIAIVITPRTTAYSAIVWPDSDRRQRCSRFDIDSPKEDTNTDIGARAAAHEQEFGDVARTQPDSAIYAAIGCDSNGATGGRSASWGGRMRSQATRQTASKTIPNVILDRPFVRSVNVIGTSTTAPPILAVR